MKVNLYKVFFIYIKIDAEVPYFTTSSTPVIVVVKTKNHRGSNSIFLYIKL